MKMRERKKQIDKTTSIEREIPTTSPHVAGDVAQVDVEVVVTVGSALFVVETDGVTQFVSYDSGQSAATGLERHLV